MRRPRKNVGKQRRNSRNVNGKVTKINRESYKLKHDIFSEVAELESVKVEDDRHTAQLTKMVEGLESTLESYK